MDQTVKDMEQNMQKSIDLLKHKLSGIRTGRASPALVEDLMVEYYGTQCALKTLATIGVPEPRTISIQPYDKNAIKDIEKAIQTSKLGINPKSEGGRVILTLPQLTEERRKELTKVVKSTAEEVKVALRNIRREVIDSLKKKKTSKEMSEDAEKLVEEEVEKSIKKFTELIDKAAQAKEKEILEV